MAKFEKSIHGDFSVLLKKIESGILHGSITATLAGSSDFKCESSRCSVRVFERYSTLGGNRVSLNVTLFQNSDGPILLSAISSGGSQAIFFKMNTFGEDAFLNKLRKIIDPICVTGGTKSFENR